MKRYTVSHATNGASYSVTFFRKEEALALYHRLQQSRSTKHLRLSEWEA